MYINNLVYDLILGLSRPEKRYVNRYAAFNRSGSRLLKLYKAVNTHQIHSDEELKATRGTAPLLRDLEVSKVHLTQLILQALRQFHRKESGERQLRGYLDDADLLWRRSHYRACAQMLRKVKKLGHALGYYTYVLEAIHMERNLMATHSAFPLTNETVSAIDAEEKSVLQALITENRFRHFAAQSALTHKRYGNSRSPDDFAAITALIANPEHAEEAATTIRAQRFYHHSMLTYYTSVGDVEGGLRHNQQILDTYSAPELIRENAPGFVIAHSNQALLHLRLKQYRTALRILDELPIKLRQAIKRPNRELLWRVQVTRLNYSLGICIECGNIELAKPLVQEAITFIEAHAANINAMRLSEMRFSIASYYLLTHQPDTALQYLMDVEASPYVRNKNDLYVSARIMQLIAHYEMGNRQLLPYLLRSVYHAIMKRERLFRFEQVLIRFMRTDLVRVVDKRSAQRNFRKLYNALEPLQDDPLEQHAFINFDILSWLDSKVRHITFAEAVAEKHGYLLK